MKHLIILILAALLITPTVTEAQKQSKKEERAAKKAEEKRLNKQKHAKAIQALDANDWVFEIKKMQLTKGEIIDMEHRPNVLGTTGKLFVLDLTYTYQEENITEIEDAPIRNTEKKVNKNGSITYKVSVNHPFPVEVIVVLNKDSNFATVDISSSTTATRRYRFEGNIVPAKESRYYYIINRGNSH